MSLALIDPQRTWQDYVERITVTWRRSIASIIETGRLLNEAKADIPHGVFEMMVASKLPFGPRSARMFMAVASNSVLVSVKYIAVLPPSWATLYELSTFPPNILEQKLMDGTITPKMERKDVLELKANCLPKEPSKSSLIDEQLKDHPSQTNRALAAALGVSNALVAQRRAVLVKRGLIPAHAQGKATRERIDAALQDDPRRSDAMIAKQLFVDQQTVTKHRKALEAAGTIAVVPRSERAMQPKRGPTWQARERKKFEKTIAFIFNACEHGSELQIPPLSAELKKMMLNRIKEAERALRTLKRNIEGGNNDSTLQ
jgi:predicted ArsR family transcriptional regulator